ncbi:putative Ig domain-containing protein [Luteolibacter sp. GHJ8]|uniref:Ig domain-containing protein n=1 Tax=Luteolibacter rhizosphaerae TaxID=2989719 RepID=A0ABT3G2E7_9BACT|nr:Calx-beta domain-containing protein [Luteolibacter rhizosphaerae]MCW1914016.1 putative Ig domain-containing protein [Luteolibacter rhizosphaerae]
MSLSRRTLAITALSVVALTPLFLLREKPATPEVAPRSALASVRPAPVLPTASAEQSADTPGFGKWVSEPIPEPDFAKIDAFDNWLGRWTAADDVEKRALRLEGAELSAARRPEFKALIASDPRLALERAVSRVIRQDLPQEIVDSLEEPVSATGDYNVYLARPAPGEEVPGPLRYFEIPGRSLKAHVSGEMLPVMSRKKIPLRGVAIDREFAVAESPVRPLEIGEEIPPGTVVEDVCPVSGETTEEVASGEVVTEDTPTVEVGERIITLCNGTHVTVLDERYRTLVQASGPGGPAFFMDAFPGTSSRAIGNFRCLYIRATYPDQMAPPNTEDQAVADMRNTTRFFLESSYGKMTTTATVTPLIVLPQTLAWYIAKDTEVDGLGTMQSQARAEARKLGYDPSQYNCIIVRVNGGLRSGSSWGGGDSVWLGWGGMDVINHECGHSLGRSHANFWQTSDGTAYGNGQNQEYGNSFDVMGGGGGFGAHYNTVSKRALGWLPDTYLHLPKTNGVFRIHAYDQPRLEEGKRYGLSVAKDSIRGYNLEYHPAKVADQALVIYSGMGSNAGHLIDTTPGSSGGKGDGGIRVGRTFTDPEADIHFTVLAKNESSPPSLDVAYFRGPFPGNQAPTLSLAASATTIGTGGSVTFTATASDPDGDALAYEWDFDDGQTAANSAVVTRSFATTAQVTAMLTVSDMKGGTARRHVVINVGSHGRQTITGNITWNATPLANVRVSNGTKYAYTDSSGNYALSGIATGSATLTATLNGFTFNPSFTNPFTVVSGANTANWTAGNSTFVTLAKTADPVEGGANGSFTLTRTGDTSADLVVRVSPVGGTATRTTDYTFNPDYATDGSYRSFTIPAGSASLAVSVAAVNDTTQEGPETIALQLASNGNYLSNSLNSMVMTVGDNDTSLPQISVLPTDPYAFESPADNGTFTFRRVGPTTSSLNISVAWSGSATAGSDYTSLPATVTFPAGQSTATINVVPINDSVIEAPEDITATINTSASYLRDGSATSATVSLSDDDSPVVTVAAVDTQASEAGPDSGMFLITRSGSTAAPLKVYYGLSGSAFHGTDYAPLTGETTIPAGSASAPVVVTPYNDDLGEPVEDVTLAVTTFNNAYSLGSAFQATLAIADNADTPVVSVRAGAAGVEGGSSASVVFRAIGSGSGNVTVNYTVSGTATSGSDYTAMSGSVSVPANGTNDVTVTIPVTNDTTPEPTETIKVTITPGAAYRVYNDGVGEAAIRDNDSGDRVAVSAYNSGAAEGGSTGKFYIARANTVGALTVNYTLSGTATDGLDYTGLTGSVVIPDTQLGEVVTFTPVNDTLPEGTEKVTLTIAAGTGYGLDRPASATLEIADNDTLPISVGFQASTSATSEIPDANGEFRDIPVVLSAASATTVTVDYVGGGGVATGDDVDWSFVDAANGNAIIKGGTLVFAPGTTSRNIRIRVKNDGVSEQSETAVLELRAANQAGLTSGLNKHSVLIFDGAVPPLVTEERWSGGTVYTNQTWSSVTPSYSGLLPGFTTALDVADNYSRRLVGQIVAPATGQYRFWIASDDASRLYLSTTSSAANKVLIASLATYTDFQNWEANDSQQSALINLVAGQSYYMEAQHQEGGGGDHLSVAWSGPGFSRTPIAGAATDVVPRTVRFVTASSTRRESDAGEPLLMAVLDRPAGSSAVTVNYTVAGTASSGSDFTLAPGTLSFAAGEQMKLLPLSFTADSNGETPEILSVALASANGAQIVSPSTHTITLLDAAAPAVGPLYVSAASTTAAGSVLGTASATPASGRSIASWSIIAGNVGNLFAINASGQVTLLAPAALPNPGGIQLGVRATDNLGATGDGAVNVVCNAPANKVVERRWAGETAFWNEDWSAATNYSGTLTNLTSAQNVADTYSRRLTGLLVPPTTGDYTFWVAGDDDCRLYLGTEGGSASKVQIASVDGYTNYQAWDSQGSQKSALIPLQAGKVYWIEAQQREGGGGDHLSVAWSGPGISRVAIPASAFFPFTPAADFNAPPAVPSIVVASPLAGATFESGSNIPVGANLAGGAQTITAVEFYRGGTLIGSDSSPPYQAAWSNASAGTYAITAKALYSGGGVVSSPVSITVNDADPSADPDGDGFNTGLELALGTNPQSSASQPPAIYASLRAWWKLDDNTGTAADDFTGRPQDGTISGAAWATGISGSALNFDGLDDGILVGNSAALTGTGNLTLAAWVKIDPGSPLATVIQQREAGATGHQGQYVLNVNASGTVNFFIYNNSAYQFDLTTAGAVNDGQWHHLAAVREGTAGRIYIDGVQAASGSGTAQALVSHPVAIGYDHRDNNKRFDGLIDDVRIYERALNAAELDGLHDGLVPNRAPAFTSDPLAKAAASEDTVYSASLAGDAGDPDFGDGLTYTKLGGPLWLAVSPSGVLSGTPANSDVGSNSFSIRVADAAGLNDIATVTIQVLNTNDTPVFAADPMTGSPATEDLAYSMSLAGSASDVDAGDTLTYFKVSGAPWVNVAPNGSVSGTPGNGDVGPNSVTIEVRDTAGASDQAVLQIAVANVNDAPAFSADPISGPAATEDLAYSGSLAGLAADIDAGDSLIYSKEDGPPWLAVAPDGTLSGTPGNADVGINSFTVRARDWSNAHDDVTLTVLVANVNDAPVFIVDPIARPTGSEEQAYTASSLSGTAVDADAGDSLTYAKIGGPLWLDIAADGSLSGTPPAGSSGTNTFTVEAKDGAGATAQATLLIEIEGDELPLPWQSNSIGSIPSNGSVTHSNGTYTVSGAGSLSGRSDTLNFAWQTMSGDGSITARITELGSTGGSARIGIMIRDTLASNSRHVFIGLDGNSTYRWVRRTSLNGNTSTSTSGSGVVPATWIRLVRSGDRITAYKSSNGTAWIEIGSLTAALPENCYAGMAVASGNGEVLNTSEFTNVSVSP